jgi:segregation and condensation protein A
VQSEESLQAAPLDGKTFQIPAFEGPLDLLLFLIQKSEINIYDIPIAEITDQFLSYINGEHVVELGDLTSFYKMAADLIYIKSRMLLPVELDFDEEYEDPRQELVERLLDYQKFRKYTELLTDTGSGGQLYVTRKSSAFRLPFGDEELFGNVTLTDLLSTFSRLITKISPSKVFNVYEEVTVNEKIVLMQEYFDTRSYITLEELIVDLTSLAHVVSAFMAILDASKHGMIILVQEENFGPILIRRRDDAFTQTYEDVWEEDEDDEYIPLSTTQPITAEDEERFLREDTQSKYEYLDDEEEILIDGEEQE